MKHIKIKMSIVIFFAIIILFIIKFSVTKHVSLGKYTWELVKDNTTVIKNSEGNIIIGPDVIILQAKYPLIYGYADSKFIINQKNDEVLLFKDRWSYIDYLKKYSINLRQEEFVTFWDVYQKAQHYSKYKADTLRKELCK